MTIKTQNKTKLRSRKLYIYLTYAISLLFIYMAIAPFLTKLRELFYPSAYLLLLATCLVLTIMIIQLQIPLKQLLTEHQLNKKTLYELRFPTLVALLLIGAFRWVFIDYIERKTGVPFFQVGDINDGDSQFYIHAFFVIIYLIFVPLQCYLANIAVQEPIFRFIGDNRPQKILSIVASAFVFSYFHLFINHAFALGMIIPGLFFASLYAKYRSIWVVSMVHFILGVFAIFMLNFNKVFMSVEEIYWI